MEDEKVSVIVPVYNVENYLPRCLDSILNQTYQNLEIILVDDGSPDNCGAICDEYAAKDNRIRVIHQKNCGVSSARNAAMEVASGEYIIFVDSDDTVLPDYVNNLMAYGDADFVAAGCRVQNAKNEWSVWNNTSMRFTLDEIKNKPELINNIPLGMVYTHRFKREILSRNMLFFCPDISRAEDTLFNCTYIMFCETIAVTDKADYLYYYYDTSATASLNTKLFRWSMESILATGKIIGIDNAVFYGRVWNNAIMVCDNYFQYFHRSSVIKKWKIIQGVFEVCTNRYVRKSLPYAKQHINRRKAILIQYCLYPFLPVVYGTYSKIRKNIRKE